MTRDLREALRIPAGSAWNIGLKLRVLLLAKQNTRAGAGNSQNVRELPKNTRGSSQKHPELPRTSRELPKTPVELPNTRRTSQKHPGRWWVVGGCWVGGFPQHPGKVLREWTGLPRGTCDTCQSLIGRRRI